MAERIYIFDTTLRDGEQSPGASMNIEDKLQMALQLERLGVDIIEAGFPIASNGEFEAVREISKVVRSCTIAGLSRSTRADIDRCWEALQDAAKPRLHTFIATSDIHMEHKLKMSREKVLQEVRESVAHAKQYCADVEFSAEDATRSDWDFLVQVFHAAIAAGATTINIPDTVGYITPVEYGRLINYLCERVPETEYVVLSSHCHNDLGLAVANSLAGIENGVRQIECCINGIGERAGNAALEEVVMALRTRADHLPYSTNINTSEIYKTSRLLSSKTGLVVPYNKPVVGRNAFAHEAGIHQHGVIQKALTYEIMTPESVGRPRSTLVMGKHSGKHGLRKRYEELGYQISDAELSDIYKRFTALADKKKEVFDDDLISLVEDEYSLVDEVYELEYFQVISGNSTVPTCTVRLRKGSESIMDSATGDGPVDAVFKAISRISETSGKLLDYRVQSVSEGKDALGEVFVRVDFGSRTVVGRAASTDIIEASAKAFLNALNKVVGRGGAKGTPA
ncbi:MAG: 2-isopropylmalate synthase [Candidatus Tectomicrobia bacterium]|nr:2-isopropylmalate synthase [Candidatus Tectomicrobia bacterium]